MDHWINSLNSYFHILFVFNMYSLIYLISIDWLVDWLIDWLIYLCIGTCPAGIILSPYSQCFFHLKKNNSFSFFILPPNPLLHYFSLVPEDLDPTWWSWHYLLTLTLPSDLGPTWWPWPCPPVRAVSWARQYRAAGSRQTTPAVSDQLTN